MTTAQTTGLVLVALVIVTVPVVLWWNLRGTRRTARAGTVLAAGLETWALSHGWRAGPPPPAPAVAQRVAVRSLEPVAAASGLADGRPARLSLWRAARSHLGSPVKFRSVVWVASTRLARSAGPEPFGIGSLTSRPRSAGDLLVSSQTNTMVAVPRALATRHVAHPWGLARIPVWPTATLPADPQRWATLAAELDRLGGFLLVEGAEVSLSVPATSPAATPTAASPDCLLRTLELAVAAVHGVPGHSAHSH